MELNKIIAKKEIDFLKGEPSVRRFWNEENTKNVDILKCINTPQKGVQSCATIGLNATNLGLLSSEKSLRCEIIGACDINITLFENILATIAFEIMDLKKCFPGLILSNIVNQYIVNTDMKHILLTSPFLWNDAKSIEVEHKIIAWLLAVPISEKEFSYARERGYDALENLFEKENIDIYNLFRKSVI